MVGPRWPRPEYTPSHPSISLTVTTTTTTQVNAHQLLLNENRQRAFCLQFDLAQYELETGYSNCGTCQRKVQHNRTNNSISRIRYFSNVHEQPLFFHAIKDLISRINKKLI